MTLLFQEQIVLITGASSGFGEATAEAFAKEGARLILLARRHDRLSEVTKRLSDQYGTEILPLEVDVSNEESVRKHLTQLPAPFDVPHILINNAGFAYGKETIWDAPPEDWNAVIDTNLKGVMYISQQIIPKMLKMNRGHIINVGSIAGHEVYPGGGIYCASKHALKALTDTLRLELVATPLRVSQISPGMARTEFSLVRYKGDEEKAENIYKGIDPLEAKDIADAIIFIASRPEHVNIADLIILPRQQASISCLHRNQ